MALPYFVRPWQPRLAGMVVNNACCRDFYLCIREGSGKFHAFAILMIG